MTLAARQLDRDLPRRKRARALAALLPQLERQPELAAGVAYCAWGFIGRACADLDHR
jgi:hypothetical protein